MYIILILVLILLIYIICKVYFEKFDTTICYTGGLGSGKSFKAVSQSIKLLRKNRFIVKIKNYFAKIHNLLFKHNKSVRPKIIENDIPMLYSSIPVFIKKTKNTFFNKYWNLVEIKYQFENDNLPRYVKKTDFAKYGLSKNDNRIKFYIESSVELTEQHLLLQTALNHHSVTFVDELGGFVNQYEYNNPNVLNCLDEFIRLYRHYTLGGYFICTEQTSDGVVKTIRGRLNKVFNLMNFRKYFNLIYKVNIREMSISEDIKTIEQDNKQDNMSTCWGFLPLSKKYDTYCYSNRYSSVPKDYCWNYISLKKDNLFHIPKKVYFPKTKNN